MTLKIDSCNDANFVITGGTASYHYDNLQCHQWWQSWYHNDSWLSVKASDDGLVPLGNRPLSEPMLTQIFVAVWHH